MGKSFLYAEKRFWDEYARQHPKIVESWIQRFALTTENFVGDVKKIGFCRQNGEEDPRSVIPKAVDNWASLGRHYTNTLGIQYVVFKNTSFLENFAQRPGLVLLSPENRDSEIRK